MKRATLIAAVVVALTLPAAQAEAKAKLTLDGWFSGTQGGPSWVGQVKAGKACANKREVSLYLEQPGKDEKIGTGKAKDNGEDQWVWVVKEMNPADGTYYAKAPRDGDCSKLKSNGYWFSQMMRGE